MVNWLRLAHSVVSAPFLAFLLLGWTGTTGPGCNFSYGDRAQVFQFENRRDEVVFIGYQYDGRAEEQGRDTVQARSALKVPIMIQSSGIRIWAINQSGQIVLDQHFLWDQLPRGQPQTVLVY